MKKKEILKDLRFLIEGRDKLPEKIFSDIEKMMTALEEGKKINKKDFIFNFTENLLDFTLESRSTPYLRQINKMVNNLLQYEDLDERSSRNLKAIAVLTKQDLAIEEAAEGLQRLTQEIKEFEDATPEAYKLSREYFKNK